MMQSRTLVTARLSPGHCIYRRSLEGGQSIIFLESKCSNKEIDWNLIDKILLGKLARLGGGGGGEKP